MGLAQVRDDAYKYGECPSADALESSFFLQYKVSCQKKEKEKEKKKKKSAFGVPACLLIHLHLEVETTIHNFGNTTIAVPIFSYLCKD